jgi:hypothetical protein
MRGPKYFCIIVGVLMVIGSTFPAPIPLVVQVAAWGDASMVIQRRMSEGVLVVDAAKLADDSGFKGQPPSAANEYVRTEIVRAIGLSTARAMRPVWVGMIVIGLMWIGVGLWIPSKLPRAGRGSVPTSV